MVAAALYGRVFQSLLLGEINFPSDTIKVLLVDGTYVFDEDNDRYLADISGEISGPGYVAGGATLTGKSLTYDAGANVVRLDADDTSWSGATFSADGAIIYDATPSVNKPLMGYVDFQGTADPQDGVLTLEWDSAGLLTFYEL